MYSIEGMYIFNSQQSYHFLMSSPPSRHHSHHLRLQASTDSICRRLNLDSLIGLAPRSHTLGSSLQVRWLLSAEASVVLGAATRGFGRVFNACCTAGWDGGGFIRAGLCGDRASSESEESKDELHFDWLVWTLGSRFSGCWDGGRGSLNCVMSVVLLK